MQSSCKKELVKKHFRLTNCYLTYCALQFLGNKKAELLNGFKSPATVPGAGVEPAWK